MTLQLTKALLVRGHPMSAKYTDKLFELFDDPNVGWDAARAIGKVPRKDKVLTKQNHAVVRVRNFLRCELQLAKPIHIVDSLRPTILQLSLTENH